MGNQGKLVNVISNSSMDKPYKLLFVCLGNICRSPAAEGIMNAKIRNENLQDCIITDSAGISGWHEGELPDPRMRQHGARRGYTFNSLSRRIKADDFYEFDMILAMDDGNYDDLTDVSPDLESRSRIYKMADFLRQSDFDHVPDPYYSGAAGFELVLDLLEDACTALLEEVKKKIRI
jgi:protein-tyrosine phosphatase